MLPFDENDPARSTRLSSRVSADTVRQKLQGLPNERLQVVGLSTGHDVSVDVHFAIDDIHAGLAQIVLDGLPGRERSAAHHVRREQQLRTVADRENWLAGKRLGERHEAVVSPQVVRRVPSRDEERVELIGPNIVDRYIRVDRLLACLSDYPFTLLGADDRDLVPPPR